MACLFWLLGLGWSIASLILALMTGNWGWTLVGAWGIIGLWFLHVGVQLRKEAKEIRLLNELLMRFLTPKERPGSGSPPPEPPEAPK